MFIISDLDGQVADCAEADWIGKMRGFFFSGEWIA